MIDMRETCKQLFRYVRGIKSFKNRTYARDYMRWLLTDGDPIHEPEIGNLRYGVTKNIRNKIHTIYLEGTRL